MRLQAHQYDSALAMPVCNGDGMNDGVYASKILPMPGINFFSKIVPQRGFTNLGLTGDGVPSDT